MSLSIHRTPRTAQGFIEPLLEVGDALSLHMVLVPGGTFLMGSPDDEPERQEDEGPQHEVNLKSFFMGRYPVTQAQWRAVASLPLVKQKLDPDPSNFKGNNRPIENVSWFDADEFCSRLARYTNRSYRLPSEAEWEYACRAGTTTPFYFGRTLTTELANYIGNYTYNDGPKGSYRKETTPVDHFSISNAFGLNDMHGNVSEWCQDRYSNNYKNTPKDGSAQTETGNTDKRILRGGSWYSNPRYCRSAFRYFNLHDYRDFNLGFRVCCSAPRAFQ
jgi:formylglycine-generating enzyme required for sulfatase activity